MSSKVKASVIAIVVPSILFLIKFVVGLVTMSMSIFASALDSLMDVFSCSIALAAVFASEKPADEHHPFGHGKAESVAGLIQAFLITVSGGFIIYQAFIKIFRGYILQDEFLGIAAMLVSMIVSVFLSRFIGAIGRKSESSVLNATALNFSADVWTNFGALFALFLERSGNVKNADPIISILISVYIIVSALRVGQGALSELMDKTLPKEMIDAIDSIVRARSPYVRGYHHLRTRRVGPIKEIDFHVEIDSTLSFKRAHDITEEIISDIKKIIPGARVTVHSDPA